MSNTATTTENPAASPALLAATLRELEHAEQIILMMLNALPPAQKARMADELEAAGIAGEGATRRHERRAVIEQAAAALGRAGRPQACGSAAR